MTTTSTSPRQPTALVEDELPRACSPMPAALVCATPDPRAVDVPLWPALEVAAAGAHVTHELAGLLTDRLMMLGTELDRRRVARGHSPFHVGPVQLVANAAGVRARIAVPEDAVADARDVASETSGVHVDVIAARCMMRALHRGALEATETTAERLASALRSRGLRPGTERCVVLLTDPRRTLSEQAKAVVLVEAETALPFVPG